jgi:hypothetical protein
MTLAERVAFNRGGKIAIVIILIWGFLEAVTR